MRTLIDIPEKDIKRLNKLSRDRKLARAELVRCAVGEYLQREEQKTDSLDRLAGIWKDRNIDGLEYQLAMRAEWNDREF